MRLVTPRTLTGIICAWRDKQRGARISIQIRLLLPFILFCPRFEFFTLQFLIPGNGLDMAEAEGVIADLEKHSTATIDSPDGQIRLEVRRISAASA